MHGQSSGSSSTWFRKRGDSNGSVLAGGTFLPQKQRRRGRAAYLNTEFGTEQCAFQCPVRQQCPVRPHCPVCLSVSSVPFSVQCAFQCPVCPQCPVCMQCPVCPQCPVCMQCPVCPQCPVSPQCPVCPVCMQCRALSVLCTCSVQCAFQCPVCLQCPVCRACSVQCAFPCPVCLQCPVCMQCPEFLCLVSIVKYIPIATIIKVHEQALQSHLLLFFKPNIASLDKRSL